MISTIASADLSKIITATLLHSLWQIAALTLLFRYAKSKICKDDSLRVSQLGMGMLVLIIASTTFTFLYYWGNVQQWLAIDIPGNGLETVSSVIVSPLQSGPTSFIDSQIHWINNIHLHITITWLIGVSILLFRIFWGYIGLQRLKRSLDYHIPSSVKKSFTELSTTLNLSKKVVMATSNRVDIPMVFGYFKPIIVFPIATITQLSSEEVDYILAHEIGHILRNDYLLNIVIILAEALFFFHPLIWWLSSEIKQAREHHCDEISLECFPNRINYAKSLLKTESLHQKSNGLLSLALFTNKPLLMNRIKRILNQPANTANQLTSRLSIGVTCLFLSLIIGASWISKDAKTNELAEEIDIHNTETITASSIPVENSFIMTDTIPNEEVEIAYARIAELQDELRRVKEEKFASMQEIKDEFEARMKSQKEEIKILEKNYSKERKKAYSERNKAHSKRNRKLEDIGEKLELWIEENGDEWEAHFEELGARIEETFDEEWIEKMEAASEALSEQFDEKWGEEFEEEASRLKMEFDHEDFEEDMAEFGEAMAELGSDIGTSVIEAMTNIDFENLKYDLEFGDAEDSDNLKLFLGSEMAEDFDLKSGKNKLHLTNDRLIVNGKRANDHLLEKYKDLIEDIHPQAFRKGETEIKLHFFGKDIRKSDKTSLNINFDQ